MLTATRLDFIFYPPRYFILNPRSIDLMNALSVKNLFNDIGCFDINY